MSAVTHDFSKSLALSHSYADAPWWNEVYLKAFPNLVSSVSVREDGWAQRAGIDRVLTFASGRTTTVDEKVRERDYQDILLELWSNEERRVLGWIEKELACEFINYAFVPSRRCFLMPTLALQSAWRINKDFWCETCFHARAKNSGYTTVSVAVPIGELMDAIRDSMLITWDEP